MTIKIYIAGCGGMLGEAFTRKNLRAIRPGYGLPPKYYDELLGKRVSRYVKRGTPVSWDLLG